MNCNKNGLMQVRVLGLVLISFAASPTTWATPSEEARKTAQQIDRLIEAGWKEAGLSPSPPSNDAEFFRRLYLDTAGAIPPGEEVIAFLRERSPNKREIAIDRLLESPRYAENQTTIWENLLLGRQLRMFQVNRESLRDWLKDSFSKNLPYDQFARELIAASGKNDENGAVNYMLRFANRARVVPEDITGHVARTFLGTQIQCAQCHDHKTEAWKQTDFHGMAAFFARTRAVPSSRPGQMSPRTSIIVREAAFGEQEMELGSGQKQTVSPKFLDGAQVPSEMSRREALANWVTAKENTWFAQAAVNRTWGLLFGRGFVDPVDDIRSSNPPSHPELLAFLAQDFVDHGYDMKHLISSILYSRTYQLSSQSDREVNPLEDRLFVRAQLRYMTPEQLFDSLFAATGLNDLPAMRRATFGDLRQRLLRMFIFVFDTDESTEDHAFDGTIPQALMLMNGELSNRGVSAFPGSTLMEVLRRVEDDRTRIQTLYLRTLSRLPSPTELTRLEGLVRKADEDQTVASTTDSSSQDEVRAAAGRFARQGTGRRQGGRFNEIAPAADPKTQVFEDLFWALINSSEFVFNH